MTVQVVLLCGTCVYIINLHFINITTVFSIQLTGVFFLSVSFSCNYLDDDDDVINSNTCVAVQTEPTSCTPLRPNLQYSISGML